MTLVESIYRIVEIIYFADNLRVLRLFFVRTNTGEFVTTGTTRTVLT